MDKIPAHRHRNYQFQEKIKVPYRMIAGPRKRTIPKIHTYTCGPILERTVFPGFDLFYESQQVK